jgi:CRISPR-associated protein Cmr6
VLAVEIMTPHHSGYLQSSGTPHANESPNPIPFLAVPASCECTLHVRCKPSLIPEAHAALRESWKALIEAAIEHAGDWLGFGAKTSVGYGRIEMDPKAQAEREAERQRLETERRQQEADAALATLPADGQLLSRLDDYLASLPADPRTGKTILQPTSGQHWLPALQILEDHVTGVSALEKPARETLATEVKKRLSGHFKVEGKADKAMKEKLAALRGS